MKKHVIFPLTSHQSWLGSCFTPCLQCPAETDRVAQTLQGSIHPLHPSDASKPALSISMCLLIPGLAQPSRAKGVSQAEDPRPPFTIVNRGCTLPVSKESQDIKEKQTSGIPPEISPLSSWYNLPQAWKLRDGPSCLVTSLVHR